MRIYLNTRHFLLLLILLLGSCSKKPSNTTGCYKLKAVFLTATNHQDCNLDIFEVIERPSPQDVNQGEFVTISAGSNYRINLQVGGFIYLKTIEVRHVNFESTTSCPYNINQVLVGSLCEP